VGVLVVVSESESRRVAWEYDESGSRGRGGERSALLWDTAGQCTNPQIYNTIYSTVWHSLVEDIDLETIPS
jgi:hypothetical protein